MAVCTANVHNVVCSIGKHHANKQEMSLMDHGAIESMASDDMMVI